MESGKQSEVSATLDAELSKVCGKGGELDCMLRARPADPAKRGWEWEKPYERPAKKFKRACWFVNRAGGCSKGSSCPFSHD